MLLSFEMGRTACARGQAILGELSVLKPAKDVDVLLVGHQPHLGRLFGRLATGRANLEIPMKKASLAAFEVDGDSCTALFE